jgi:hypothetical protein
MTLNIAHTPAKCLQCIVTGLNGLRYMNNTPFTMAKLGKIACAPRIDFELASMSNKGAAVVTIPTEMPASTLPTIAVVENAGAQAASAHP